MQNFKKNLESVDQIVNSVRTTVNFQKTEWMTVNLTFGILFGQF